MRTAADSNSRLLGYVQVQVASRVYKLPVEAAPLLREDGTQRTPGFFADGSDHFGILVDSHAPNHVQEQTIAQASADAARHISHKLLN